MPGRISASRIVPVESSLQSYLLVWLDGVGGVGVDELDELGESCFSSRS